MINSFCPKFIISVSLNIWKILKIKIGEILSWQNKIPWKYQRAQLLAKA